MNPAPRRILVLRIRYLGDTLLLRPVLRALNRTFPDAELDALIHEGTEVALEGDPSIRRTILWPKCSTIRSAPTILYRQLVICLRIFLGNYDWVIDLTQSDRSAFLCLLSRARVRAGHQRKPVGWTSWRNLAWNIRPLHPKTKPHILEQHFQLLRACGVEPRSNSLELTLPPHELAWAAQLLHAWAPGRQIVHAHLCSRDMQKSLPPPLVRDVLDQLVARNVAVVLTHGQAPSERIYAAACSEGYPKDWVRVLDGLSWWQLVAIASCSDVYWGVDTAPMHAASALNKPMLIHFGPSPAEYWRPLNPNAEVMESHCSCLRDKMRSCPSGEPGKCWTKLEGAPIAERILCLLPTS